MTRKVTMSSCLRRHLKVLSTTQKILDLSIKALLSAFIVLAYSQIQANDSKDFALEEALSSEVKSYVIMNYYDLRRKVLLGLSNNLSEIRLELKCPKSITNSDLINKFRLTESPMDAVKLLEELDDKCSE